MVAPLRSGKFTTENRPNKKHHKMFRPFSKPPGQLPGEYSREYPRATSVEGDDRRYRGLEIPMGDNLFAAYESLEIKNVKYPIVASSDYLYTPRSLFWPDVNFLTVPTLDWGQAAGMAISVQRIVTMDPQVMIIAGSNYHLQSRGLQARLTEGTVPSDGVMGEAIMTLLSAMAEVQIAVRQRFTRKLVFVLSPRYAETLQFVYLMVTKIAEGRFDLIIPAPNRSVDHDNYYPLRSELPAVWRTLQTPSRDLRSIAQLVCVG